MGIRILFLFVLFLTSQTEIYAQDLSQSKRDSIALVRINETLNTCFENLDNDSDLEQLKVKFDDELCRLSNCVVYYSMAGILNLDSAQQTLLVNRALEINYKHFESGAALKIYQRGGYGGGEVSFKRYPDYVEIVLPVTCTRFETDIRAKEIYDLINAQTKKLLKLENYE